MKVKIIIDCHGTEDGYIIRKFKAGMEYDIKEKLAKSFTKIGNAIYLNSEIKEEVIFPKSPKLEIVIAEEVVAPKEEVIEEVKEEIKEEEIEIIEESEEEKPIEEVIVKKETKKKNKKKKKKKNAKSYKKKIKEKEEKEEKIKRKMLGSYENKAINSSSENKKIIKKIKIKR